MKKTPWYKSPILYAAIAVALLFLLLRQCSETKKIKSNKESIYNYLSDTISYYENKQGKIVAEKNALRGDISTLNILLGNTTEQLEKLQETYSNVSTAGEVTTITEIDTVKIKYTDTIAYVFNRKWSIDDKFYSVSGASNQIGIEIETLTIPNTLSFVIGEKKGKYTIEAVNSNPYIKTTGLDAYTFDVPKKRFGLSIYAGYGLSDDFTFSPSIGVALTWDLFSF